jgi:hypothetical protein
VSFIGFRDLDEMVAFMQRAEQAANGRVVQAQRDLTYGDLWVRFHQVAIIFGRVHTLEEIRDTELKLGASEAEVEETLAQVRERFERGYLFGTCFSVVEPDGELGDTHRSQVWPCPLELYQEAEAKRWELDGLEPWAIRALRTLHADAMRVQGGGA